VLDAQGDVGWDSSIKFDADGNPHISYYDVSNGNLKYAYRAGSSWAIETVDSEWDVGQWTSLAVDGGGTVHITYQDVSHGTLKHAWKTP
jgi:hypothetical protein